MPRRRPRTFVFLLTPLLGWVLVFSSVGVAQACGLCREDNRAAVYSFEAMQRVEAHPNTLEFVVIKVKGRLPADVVSELSQWLARRRGVDRQTIKISTTQKSIGFIFKKKESTGGLLQALGERFPDLTFTLL